MRETKPKLAAEPHFLESLAHSIRYIAETVNHERLGNESIDSMMRMQRAVRILKYKLNLTTQRF